MDGGVNMNRINHCNSNHDPDHEPVQKTDFISRRSVSAAAALVLFGSLTSACTIFSPETDSETGSFDTRIALMFNAALSGSLTSAQQTLNSDVTFASPTASASSVSTSFTALHASGGSNGLGVLHSGFGPPPPIPTDGIEDIANARTFSQRKTQLLRILSATSPEGCRFRPNLAPSPPAAKCFGPQLFYAGLPVPDRGALPANGVRPPFDLGIWNITNQATGEACVAAQVNSLADDLGTYLSSAIGLAAMMQCHARFAFGRNPPEVGEERDLTALFSSKIDEVGGSQKIVVSTARLSRQGDVDGNPVYSSTMSITFGTQGNLTFILDHSPNTSNNDLFKGLLSLSIRNPNGLGPGTKCSGSAPKQLGVSVAYEKNATDSLRYRLRKALFCTESNTAIFKPQTRQIDFNSKYNATTNPIGWVDNAFDITFNLNPNDGTGKFTSAWQAGINDNATRAFALRLDSTSGTGFFGFGPDISGLDGQYNNISTDVMSGMFCNWLNGQSAGAKQPRVQRQGMLFSDNKWINDSTAGTTRVTFAPTNNCNKTGGDGHRYSTSGPGLLSSPMTNDKHLNAGSVTNNLVDLTALSTVFDSLPTRPTSLK